MGLRQLIRNLRTGNIMNRIIVNGSSHGVAGKDVKFCLMVDGHVIEDDLPLHTHVQWYGDLASVSASTITVEGNVTGGNVSGATVNVQGSITADSVSGATVKSNGPIYAKKVSGATVKGVIEK